MTLTQTLSEFLANPSHLPKNIIWRFPKTVSQRKHIFVLGAPRSGTTLVKLILGAHPNLTGPGYETAFFMDRDIFSFKFREFSQNEIDSVRNSSQDIVDFFDKFAQLNLEKFGGSYYIEKTPPHVLKLPFLIKYFPQSKFINIYRDGRDCYCSARRHPNVVQGSNIKRYARYWRRCIQARLKLGEHPNILDIKYEDLVKDPETIVKKIMGFIGEEFQAQQLDSAYYSQNSISKSAQKRQELSKLIKPIDSSSTNRYLQELSVEEINQFNQIARQELQLLGYPL